MAGHDDGYGAAGLKPLALSAVAHSSRDGCVSPATHAIQMWISQPSPSIAGRAPSGSRSLIVNETQSSFASGALKSKARFSSVRTERRDTIGVHMKKIILATVLAGLCSTAALAADLGARSYSKAPAMVAVSNWSGFYIGGNVGYGWGSNHTEISYLPDPVQFGVANTSLDSKSHGVIGGAQIGYNWQMGSLLTGLEADIQGSGIRASAKAGPVFNTFELSSRPGSFISSDQKLLWFGTVRGRLGVAITPDLLLYGTGGLAYGQVDDSAQTFETVTAQFPATANKIRIGWTAGAGAEWMFARQWSAKVEYLYFDLGDVSATSNNPLTGDGQANYAWNSRDHIVRAGVNYHF